jgi:hypothetical protein
MEQQNPDRVLDLILSQLEKLNINQEKLSQEIQKTNLELAKIGNLQGTVDSFEEWKISIERVLNAEDLKEIKKFFSNNYSINAEITDLYNITKELRDSVEDYKKFKVRAMTIVSVLSFIFGTAITILVKLIH